MEPSDLTTPDETESLWQTIKGDFEETAGLRIIALALMLTWMAFQWGWGNDILLPPIVARAFEAVDDGVTWGSGFGAIAAGIAAGSLFWAFTQALDGAIVLGGLTLIPGVTARISRMLRRQGWVKPYQELSWGTRFVIAYLSGASALCLIDVFATGEQGFRQRRRMLANAVLLAVAGVAAVIAIVTTALAVGTRIPATRETAEFVVRYARNPLVWLLIYGIAIGGAAIMGKLGEDDESASEPESVT